MRNLFTSFRLRSLFLLLSFLLVLVGILTLNRLAAQMAEEEQSRIELWAEATRQIITADEETDISFALSIIENNTTIPVFMTDQEGRYIMSRNVDSCDYQARVDRLRETEEPIVVDIDEQTQQFIYHEDSDLLRKLHYLPWITGAILLLYLVVIILSLFISQRAEQDHVWAGLSKETAHQLGTPISSLNACQTILQDTYPDDPIIPEMQKDISRLTTIADRFQKIGSLPRLEEQDIVPIVRESIGYMQHRTSDKIRFTLTADKPLITKASAPLLGWVIENLLRNAVDASDGVGEVAIRCAETAGGITIEVEDHGKGISRSHRNRIFTPGFTTKQRGWGMGLSLSRRIIETYHHGQIILKDSTPGQGSTFLITLAPK